MRLTDLAGRRPEWLRGSGPHGDVILSSRLRLARNLAGMPFLSKCGEGQLRELATVLRRTLVGLDVDGKAEYADLEKLDELDRQLLVERHLISRQHAEAKGPRGVAIAGGETIAVMVNEEDHLRVQVLRAGLELDACAEQGGRLDNLLEAKLTFAFSSRFGYLTACPTNVGTGLRVSVMAHLPALKMTGDIEKVLRAARDMRLAVRGLYGEGTEAVGDLFQISNQTTLGRTEEQIVQEFRDVVVPGIIDYERRARKQLLAQRRVALEDKIFRAQAVLQSARLISSEEALYLLSQLRLGLALGLVRELTADVLNELSLLILPAHLQRLAGREMNAIERGEARATVLRQKLGGA